ncbi:sensor domain-containing diguanylate cyclase [Xanthobacter sp. V4C-4]|uniref:sensor domain-containing diguanylate cyclase n=1 Tax=Xanthobacter cornucopiae TaxID=3119924 RepID=UPI00372AB684
MIIAIQAYVLIRSRADTWRDIERSAENMTQTLAASIERNLSILELSLDGVEQALRLPELATASPHARDMLLFDRSASAEFLGSMLVLDTAGKVLFYSGYTTPIAVDLSDRDYFTAQQNGPRPHFISVPFDSRVRSGDPSIALSRRLATLGGTFEGVAVAVVRLSYFRSLFGKLDLGPGSVVSLVRTDGTIIYRQPSVDGRGNAGTNVANSRSFQKSLAQPGEGFITVASIDGVKRYFLSRRIGAFPLLLVVGISVDQALRHWFIQAVILSGLTIAVCGLLLYVIVNLRRALRHSYEMEEQLATMALTDPLTGMPNRRGFGMAAETEMRRAARDQKDLSLLMIDVDHFKQVNDRHGHPFGDQILAQIARQIQAAIRRPGDFAARFGGEEFVVLLPATGSDGALLIAERMRAAIADIALIKDGVEVGVTVSVGVSTARVMPGERVDALVSQADAALYEAKSAGRNRISFRAMPQALPPPGAEALAL